MNRYLDKRDTDYVRDNLIFNYCLGKDQELLIESYVHNNSLDIRFDVRRFFFFMTGTHKKFSVPFTPETFHAGVDGIYRMYDEMRACLLECGYDGNVFLIKEDNSKQIGILFSPSSGASISPDEMSQKLFDLHLSLFPQKKHSSTSFVGPYSGYEQIHQAFLDARELNDLYFFGIHDRVITKEFYKQTAKPCDISAILANVRRLTSTLCTGSEKEALCQMDYLISNMIVPSYSYLNFAALWAAFEDVLGMFETVYPQLHFDHRDHSSFYTIKQYQIWTRETLHMLYEQLSSMRRYSPTILMALSFINRNFTADISLTQLSEYVYTNSSTLSSEFNAEVGMSLSEYITSLRIQKAQKLLKETNVSVPEIAMQAGFASAKYFREIFKKQVGLSPSQYRDR